MSIKDHLMKLTMWWQEAQKLQNDRPGGEAASPAPLSVSPLAMLRVCFCASAPRPSCIFPALTMVFVFAVTVKRIRCWKSLQIWCSCHKSQLKHNLKCYGKYLRCLLRLAIWVSRPSSKQDQKRCQAMQRFLPSKETIIWWTESIRVHRFAVK